jgi:hypothetical protein
VIATVEPTGDALYALENAILCEDCKRDAEDNNAPTLVACADCRQQACEHETELICRGDARFERRVCKTAEGCFARSDAMAVRA